MLIQVFLLVACLLTVAAALTSLYARRQAIKRAFTALMITVALATERTTSEMANITTESNSSVLESHLLLQNIQSSLGAAASELRMEHVSRRFEEARMLLVKQEALARLNSRATFFLGIGQYIVGGILATSFVQDKLSPTLAGALGIVVIGSQLINQAFHPSVLAKNAKSRAVRLRQIIREAEDQLAVHGDSVDAVLKSDIIRQLSQGTFEVERDELSDYEQRITQLKDAVRSNVG